jgi:hypothetical protein
MIPEPNGKEWWKSKMLWLNVAYIVIILVGGVIEFEGFEPSQDMVVFASALLAIVNIVLRWFTKQAIRW